MDPRDRLWVQLIFPRCDPRDLLALRGACRAFLAQLSAAPARLWQPLTMEVSRMSYAERTMGWAGVAVAMERECVTRANCDAGRFGRGATLGSSDVIRACQAGGRIAMLLHGSVKLCDADSGAAVTFDTPPLDRQPAVVLDRWLVYGTHGGQLLLLDCVAVALTELDGNVAPPVWSACGPRVAHRSADDVTVTIVHVGCDGPDLRDTVVRVVARVALPRWSTVLELCQRGRSYLLCDTQTSTLQLCDVASGQPIRTFTAPPGQYFTAVQPYVDSDYFVARVAIESYAAVRISDGRVWGNLLHNTAALLRRGGRVFAVEKLPLIKWRGIVDVDTGVLHSPVEWMTPDTSGALLWVGRNRAATVSGGAAPGVALPAATLMSVFFFSFGVALVRNARGCYVLRFDAAFAADAAERDRKASAFWS